jgi:hypothetical protein
MATQPPATNQAQGAPPNLDRLARQILPLVKRLLAIERERGAHL